MSERYDAIVVGAGMGGDPSQGSDCQSFIGSAEPRGEAALGVVELMNLSEADMAGIAR